jgi:hypothetical protein
MDYKARFYSPVLNRFIQPDSIIPETYNPQTWNRYSYVNNRPINLNDPTGHCPQCIVIAGVALSPLTVGIIMFGIVATTAMMVCNAHAPCHNAAVDGISNAADSIFQMGKRKATKQEKAQAEIEANSKLTAEERLYSILKCDTPSAKFICISGIIAFASLLLNAPKRGACEQPEAAVWIPCPNPTIVKPTESTIFPNYNPTPTPPPLPVPTSNPTPPVSPITIPVNPTIPTPLRPIAIPI